MSSLAAAQADGYYVPPDYDPVKHGSHKRPRGGGAPLRKGGQRQKEDATQVVRFELMFDCRCTACERVIAQGTRFNASKRLVGHYHSSPKYRFSFRCAACSAPLAVESDPANDTFVVTEGLRLCVAAAAAADAAAQVERERRRMQTDPMARLERSVETSRRARAEETLLTRLQRRNEAVSKDDAMMNSLLRSKNRLKRKEEQKLAEQGAALGLCFPLAPEDEVEAQTAARVMAREGARATAQQPKRRRRLERLARDPFLAAPTSGSAGSTDDTCALTVLRVVRRRRRRV